MKIAHISDLHFGCLSEHVLAALEASLAEDAPDLVIASGDITQDATVPEFEAASAFFKGLAHPVLVIPGNHDLPGIDLVRFLDPFGRYTHHIAPDMEPSLRNPLVDIKGINSARVIMPHYNWANGGVSRRQRRDIAAFFAASAAPWRMLVLHHPLVSARELPLDVVVYGLKKAMETICEHRIDLVLSGHQHHAFTETRETDGHTTLFLSASTTTSQRLRRQPNGYNRLTFSESAVRVDMLRYHGDRFETFEAMTHTKTTRKA